MQAINSSKMYKKVFDKGLYLVVCEKAAKISLEKQNKECAKFELSENIIKLRNFFLSNFYLQDRFNRTRTNVGLPGRVTG
jgi:hypothetical protein